MIKIPKHKTYTTLPSKIGGEKTGGIILGCSFKPSNVFTNPTMTRRE
jgi:hypothetical protein